MHPPGTYMVAHSDLTKVPKRPECESHRDRARRIAAPGHESPRRDHNNGPAPKASIATDWNFKRRRSKSRGRGPEHHTRAHTMPLHLNRLPNRATCAPALRTLMRPCALDGRRREQPTLDIQRAFDKTTRASTVVHSTGAPTGRFGRLSLVSPSPFPSPPPAAMASASAPLIRHHDARHTPVMHDAHR
jgi:hypothetical protein